MNNHKPSRGEVWFVNLDPVVGHEQAKTRPCLVISDDIFNHGPANLHIIVPLTSKSKNNLFRVPLEWLEGGSDIESFILCDQIRSVSRQRFKRNILGSVTQRTLDQVQYALGMLLRGKITI
jgi:mRNA interferase MazF